MGKMRCVRSQRCGGGRFNKSGPTWCWGMLGAQLMPSPCLSDERMIMRTKWREDEGEESRCIKPCLTGLFAFHATLYFCSEIKLLCAIIQAPCWGDVAQSNAIFPLAATPICAPEKVRSCIISCLPGWLFNIVLSNAMQCPFVGV